MPFALIIVAIIAITVGLRGTQGDLYNLLKADFSGPGNFFFWLVSVLVIGALGYIKTIKPVSDALLLLLVLVLFLRKDRGFFDQFNKALASTQNAAPASNNTTQIFGGGSWFPLGDNTTSSGSSAPSNTTQTFGGGSWFPLNTNNNAGASGETQQAPATSSDNNATVTISGPGYDIVGPPSLKDFFNGA